MITLAWYLLKVIICSGILCGYYFLALRNKAFHRWNRFYLLAAIVISLLIPIMKINIFQSGEDKGTVVQVLQTISYGDEAVIEYSHNSGFQLTTENITEAAYLLISATFLFIFLFSIYKIKRLRKKYPETRIEDVSFINTNEKGTPFSFFKSIFWNQAIDLHSRSGQQIFNHEIAHVKEKHSYDKIFMNIVLIFFWINPFFWLMRKELYMIHEFIADKEALEDNDINAFAEMILQTVYPGQNFSIGNAFFYSPIKRRLLMLTKNKNSKVNYASRLLVLPLAAIVFFAFTLKVKNSKSVPLYDGKTITVVIDAGHGGNDHGAIDGNIQEKDLTLAIAEQVKKLNENKNINIVLTRDKDEFISVKDRAKFTNEQKADLFVSIHIDAEATKNLHSGLNVFIAKNDNQYFDQSKLLGSSIIEAFKTNYLLPVPNHLMQREKGVWVLKVTQCPSVIVEAGFLTTQKDFDYLTKSQNQQAIARNILNGIENYSQQNVLSNAIITPKSDTIPPILYNNKKLSAIKYLDPSNNVEATYSDSSKETITKEEALKRGFIPQPDSKIFLNQTNALFVIDGKITTKEKASNLNPNEIKSINILKGETAINKYGEKGKYGVIGITTKKDEDFTIIADTFHIGDGSSSKPITSNSKLNGSVFYINSKFPEGTLILADGEEISQEEMKNIPPNNIQSVHILKGETATKKYGEKAIEGAVEITTKNNIPPNTLIIIDGKESTADELKNMPPSNIESIIVLKGEHAIKKYGNKAKDGAIEIITKENSTTISVRDTMPDKVFTKVEIEAHFPGGVNAWQKYIAKVIVASLDSFTEKDYGTCVLKFIVNTDGTVSNIEATTMKGTNLAKISVNAIKNGPKWIPASQNGHTVAAYRLQPVTLTNPVEKSSSINVNENPKTTL